MDFAPGLSKLQDYVIEKNPNEPDPFIIRRVGIPHWLGGYEALDGIFVHSIGKSGNTPAVSRTNSPKRFVVGLEYFLAVGKRRLL